MKAIILIFLLNEALTAQEIINDKQKKIDCYYKVMNLNLEFEDAQGLLNEKKTAKLTNLLDSVRQASERCKSDNSIDKDFNINAGYFWGTDNLNKNIINAIANSGIKTIDSRIIQTGMNENGTFFSCNNDTNGCIFNTDGQNESFHWILMGGSLLLLTYFNKGNIFNNRNTKNDKTNLKKILFVRVQKNGQIYEYVNGKFIRHYGSEIVSARTDGKIVVGVTKNGQIHEYANGKLKRIYGKDIIDIQVIRGSVIALTKYDEIHEYVNGKFKCIYGMDAIAFQVVGGSVMALTKHGKIHEYVDGQRKKYIDHF